MTTIEQPAVIDTDKLMSFVFRAVDEVGATLNAALVVMGDRLGLYRALAGAGPLTPAELAERTGTAERYVREWLNAQAAGGYVDYDPDSGRYTLPPEQAVALTDETSPAYLPGLLPDRARLGARLAADHRGGPHRRRASAGTSTTTTSSTAASGSSAPATTPTWSPPGCPALDGVVDKLERGAHGGRRRLRPRRLDDPDGAGVPELDVRRLRLPRRARSRPRAQRAAEAGVARPGPLRGRAGRRLLRRAATTW